MTRANATTSSTLSRRRADRSSWTMTMSSSGLALVWTENLNGSVKPLLKISPDPDYSKRDMFNQIENGNAGKGELPECTVILSASSPAPSIR